MRGVDLIKACCIGVKVCWITLQHVINRDIRGIVSISDGFDRRITASCVICFESNILHRILCCTRYIRQCLSRPTGSNMGGNTPNTEFLRGTLIDMFLPFQELMSILVSPTRELEGLFQVGTIGYIFSIIIGMVCWRDKLPLHFKGIRKGISFPYFFYIQSSELQVLKGYIFTAVFMYQRAVWVYSYLGKIKNLIRRHDHLCRSISTSKGTVVCYFYLIVARWHIQKDIGGLARPYYCTIISIDQGISKRKLPRGYLHLDTSIPCTKSRDILGGISNRFVISTNGHLLS